MSERSSGSDLEYCSTKAIAILFENYPIGLAVLEDEYEPEARKILLRITECSVVLELEDVIYEMFCAYFNEEVAGLRENYQPIAAKVWEMWREFNKSQGS